MARKIIVLVQLYFNLVKRFHICTHSWITVYADYTKTIPLYFLWFMEQITAHFPCWFYWSSSSVPQLNFNLFIHLFPKAEVFFTTASGKGYICFMKNKPDAMVNVLQICYFVTELYKQFTLMVDVTFMKPNQVQVQISRAILTNSLGIWSVDKVCITAVDTFRVLQHDRFIFSYFSVHISSGGKIHSMTNQDHFMYWLLFYRSSYFSTL